MALYEGQIVLAYAPGGPGTITLFAIGRTESDTAFSSTKATAWRNLINGFMTEIAGPSWGGVSLSIRPKVVARNPVTGEALAEFGVAAGGATGGNPGESLPQMSSLVAGWRTVVPSRRFRGRSFLPPAAEISNGSDGTPDGAYLTAMRLAGTNFIAASAGSLDVGFVVWSRPREADPTAVPPVTARPGAFQLVDTVSIRDVWGSLRSRRD